MKEKKIEKERDKGRRTEKNETNEGRKKKK